jgi:predicted NBD/HSP70 family sugar kinase
MHYLGLDIGGTSIKAGLVDETGRILESRRAPTVGGDLNGFVSNLTELIGRFQKVASIGAIGIGVPGLRSSKTRIIETAPNIPCLKKINFRTPEVGGRKPMQQGNLIDPKQPRSGVRS